MGKLFVSYSVRFIRNYNPSTERSFNSNKAVERFKNIDEVRAFEKDMAAEYKLSLGEEYSVRVSVITWRAFDSGF